MCAGVARIQAQTGVTSCSRSSRIEDVDVAAAIAAIRSGSQSQDRVLGRRKKDYKVIAIIRG